MRASDPRNVELLAQKRDVGLHVVVFGARLHAPHFRDRAGPSTPPGPRLAISTYPADGELLVAQVDGLRAARRDRGFPGSAQGRRRAASRTAPRLGGASARAGAPAARPERTAWSCSRRRPESSPVILSATASRAVSSSTGVLTPLRRRAARHGEAVHLRQHDVQDDDVVPAVFAIGKPGQRRRAPRRRRSRSPSRMWPSAWARRTSSSTMRTCMALPAFFRLPRPGLRPRFATWFPL